MSKHKILTQEEIDNFKLNYNVLHEIEKTVLDLNLAKDEIRILDFGCGRGRTLMKLYELGYKNIYGVDNDLKTLNNGRVLFQHSFNNPENILRQICNNKTDFPDNFFHFIFSEQVFEHIKNIKSVVQEISRITIKNGKAYHQFPSPKKIKEDHLYMPFVHWIPKCYLRYFFILFFVILKKEPFWEELSNKSRLQKTMAYYKYLNEKTYYRSYFAYEKLFAKYGIESTYDCPNIKDSLILKIIRSINNKIYKAIILSTTSITIKTKKI